jgi:hypothetical protein
MPEENSSENKSENSKPAEEAVENLPTELKEAFESNAVAVASQFSIDLDSIKKAYADKPESLSAAFNTMSEAKSDRNRWIGWSVAWLIFVPPIMLYTGWKAYEANEKLSGVKNMVNNEVLKSAPSTKP